ncbi:MAG: response regulator transcription factor [Burkholderiales bacterium]|nr:response regulator transcription factor [Burkholderiales bacterium]
MAAVAAATPIRVALVEDDVHFQHAVAHSVSLAPDMVLTHVVGTLAQGLSLLEGTAPDVLLVDLGLPDGSGIDLIQAAHSGWSECGIVVCTALGDEVHVIRSIEAGAAGYLLKDSAPEHILDEIRSLRAGGSPISPLIARKILSRFRDMMLPQPPAPQEAQPDLLSKREHEVLHHISRGFTAEEIAQALKVSHHTVLSYVRRIYGKLEVNSKVEAINEARHRGWLKR